MKILHISRNDSSGAGLCAYRIHKTLQLQGIQSKMLVLYKSYNDDSVVRVFKKRYFLQRLFHLFMRKIGIYVFEYDKLVKLSCRYKTPFTRPISPFSLNNHPLVKEADIIHLHWVDDFFNQKEFLIQLKKPIVWTVHDEGFFYGITHYHDSVLSENPLEKKYRHIKTEMVKGAYNLHLVFLSDFFIYKFKSSLILQGQRYSVISNSVDCSRFKAYNKEESRAYLNLRNEYIYVSFVANNILDSHKGLETLIKAIHLINNERIKIIAIGNDKNFKGDDDVITTGMIKDSDLMSRYLSASDLFIMPSLQEAFSQAPIEAMACGKPAVVTPVSGTSELIKDFNGIICAGFTSNEIADGIVKALKIKYDSNLIRNDVNRRFSPNYIASEYLKVYNSILNNL